jgi:hypothetical protein
MKKTLIFITCVNLFFASIIISFSLGYSIDSSSGKSMCPNLGKYSIVINERIDNLNEIKLGDVYTYRVEGVNGTIRKTQHRCVGIAEDYFVFKGDNNLDSEVISKEAVYKKQIISFPIIKCEEKEILKEVKK